MNKTKKIISESLFFTHGGSLGSLYGLLSTGHISSNNALRKHGDYFSKFTDSENNFSSEDNFLFFESPVDRDNLFYSSLKDKDDSSSLFSFVLIASADTLLNQVDTVSNSDGVLLGLSSNEPLEIDLKNLNFKILIPSSYKNDVLNYLNKIKELGIDFPIENIIFKPLEEINQFNRSFNSEESLSSQLKFLEKIDLKSSFVSKQFNQEKIIKTKTSEETSFCSERIISKKIEETKFNSVDDLISYMKKRPTLVNLQKNSMFLLGFSRYSNDNIKHLDNNVPIISLLNNYENLCFVINNFIELCPEKETSYDGSIKVSSSVIRDVVKKLKIKNNDNLNIEIIKELLDLAQEKKITVEDCQNISTKLIKSNIDKLSILSNILQDLPPPLLKWHIVINQEKQPLEYSTDEVKDILLQNKDKEIKIWRPGLTEWKYPNQISQFKKPITYNISTENVLKNIELSKKSLEITSNSNGLNLNNNI